MSNQSPILSICIPTNGVVRWVVNTLKGIYSQQVDLNQFEVIVADNGLDSELDAAIKQFDYPNLYYYHTKEKGFVNQIASFKLGSGEFCKMFNHRSILVPGALQRMIDTVIKYRDEKPILYWSDGVLDYNRQIACANADEFTRTMHYWSTWSSGVGIWREDIEKLDGLNHNATFPHTSLMYGVRQKSRYVIIDEKVQNEQDENGKGGYDVFWAFAVEFPNYLRSIEAKGQISHDTYEYVLKKLFEYVGQLYNEEIVHRSKSTHTYILKNVPRTIMVNYGLKGYLTLVKRYWGRYWKRRLLGRKDY